MANDMANATPGRTMTSQTVRSASRCRIRGTGSERMYSYEPSVRAWATICGVATRPIVMSVIAGAPVARKRTVRGSSSGKSRG